MSVAISWKSDHSAQSWVTQLRKSGSAEVVAPLACDQLVDVQYGNTGAERALMAENSGREIVRFRDVDHFNDLEDILTIMAACDLVITTRNITVHFAGAMRKPTWLLYPAGKTPFFCWVATADGCSRWYPSVEVVTDPQLSDWSAASAQVARRLELHAKV